MKDDRPYLADILQALHRVEEVRRRGEEAFRGDWVLMERRVTQLHEDVARLVAALGAPA